MMRHPSPLHHGFGGENMKLNRALGYAVAALGLLLMLPEGALADESWQGYAPRCQPTELASDAALRDPCEMQVATFGLRGPMVLGRSDSIDVHSTGSIDRDAQRGRNGSRSPL